MRNVIEEYTPFEHKNLEYINGSLNLARQQRNNGTLEGLMAATVIYTNLVEYLARNLLENLHHMIFLLSYHHFNGIIFLKNREKLQKKSPQTLGQLKESLSHYEFPDSTDFLNLLQKFSETRNSIFHRLLTISKEEIDKGIIDKQFSDLHDLAEEILDKYNALTKGVTSNWYNVTASQAKKGDATKEQLESQITALLGQISELQARLVEKEKSEKGKK